MHDLPFGSVFCCQQLGAKSKDDESSSCDSGAWTADRGLRVSVPDYGLRTMDDELWTMDNGLRTVFAAQIDLPLFAGRPMKVETADTVDAE